MRFLVDAQLPPALAPWLNRKLQAGDRLVEVKRGIS